MEPARQFANSSRLLIVERKFRGVLSVAAGVLEFAPDEGQTAPPVRVPTADIRAIRHNTATKILSIFSERREPYCFEIASDIAEVLLAVMRAEQPVADVSYSTFLPQIPALVGPVAVEIGGGVTVEGTLALQNRTLRYVPSLAARLCGNRTYAVPLSQAASRRNDDDPSQVKFRLLGDTHVMSGSGAQHVWLGMQLLDCAAVEGEEFQPLAIREDRRGTFDEEALLGLTASHVGAARAVWFGAAPPSFWHPIAALEAIESEGSENVLVATGRSRYPVRGLGADEWISALRIRWLSVALARADSEDARCIPAVLIDVTCTWFGHLEVSPSGIVFHPSSGESIELALPGNEVVCRIDPDYVHNLRIAVDAAHHRLLVRDASGMANEIDFAVGTASWTLGQADLEDVPLTTQEISQLVGQATYIHLFIDDVRVAEAKESVVSRQVRDLQCALVLVAERPQFPCLAVLELAGAKGRFLARVQVVRIGEEASQANGAAAARPVRFLLRLMSHVDSKERRKLNRLKVNEPIDIRFVPGRKSVLVEGDVRIVNLSVSGCALEASEAPDPAARCVFRVLKSEPRPEDLPIEVHGKVRSVRQVNDKKFRVGLIFVVDPSAPKKVKGVGAPADLGGTQLYQDRERKRLRDLAEQRAADEERRRE